MYNHWSTSKYWQIVYVLDEVKSILKKIKILLLPYQDVLSFGRKQKFL